MSYTNVYPTRINWENEPSIASPINATNLNKIDYAVYEHDQTFGTWDVTKANQSDLLLSVKSIDYDDETGVFVFTWQNGTTKTVDLNIEKIPVSFSMSPLGVITMTTDDGTQYTADVGSLIKTYTFVDSSVIDFTVTTDLSGNKTVTADIVNGSITGNKLQPDYLADCTAAKTGAETAADKAEDNSEDSEAWAVGTRDGVPVPSSDPAYENNAKYWAQHTSASLAGLSDTDITSPTDGQVLGYDGTKWINKEAEAGGGSTIIVGTNEASLYGESCTITDGVTTLTETINNSGVATFKGVTLTGSLTITATNGVDTATRMLTVPYFGNYTATLSFFSATITVTYPSGAVCTITDGTTTLTATGSPMAFNIPNAGTWTATATLDGVSKQGTPITITTDGQTASDTIIFGTINLTISDEFRGQTITATDGISTITKTAPMTGNTMTLYPNATGNWTISGVYSGVTYVSSPNPVVVSSLSTPVSATLQTIASITVDMYGGAGSVITWTNADSTSGTCTLDSTTDKGHGTATIKVIPSGSNITFTDTTVAKNPSDLTANYTKTINVTSATTSVYVMPDNTLYWYGYEGSNFEEITYDNGWSIGSWTTEIAPIKNTLNITLTGAGFCGISSKNIFSGINNLTFKSIISQSAGVGKYMDAFNAKIDVGTDTRYQLPDTGAPIVVTYNPTMQNGYPVIATQGNTSTRVVVDAFWYE